MSHTIEDVVARGMCVGCGSCSVRTSGAVPVTIGRYGTYTADLTNVDAATRAAASRVCPFSDDATNENDLGDSRFEALPQHDGVGHYHSVLAGRITNESELLNSSSGGLTSFYLAALLTSGRVDGIIHVGSSGAASPMYEYRLSYSPEEAATARKSAYYATTIDDVLAKVKGDGKRYAVVGIPCFIKAFRLLAETMPEYGEQLQHFVGLVCGHLKSQFFAQSLGWQAGVSPDELERTDFRVKNPSRKSSDYDYAVWRRGTDEPRLKRTGSTVDGNWGYGAFQPEACNFCDDIFAEGADVVFADAWLPQYVDDSSGTNLVVIRDERARAIFDEGLSRGELALDELTVNDAVASQGGNFRHRRVGLRVRLADDIAAGLSVPRKRVEPGYDGISRSRIALVRQRRAMSALSLRAFRAALDARDLTLYTKPMEAAVRRYVLVDGIGRGAKGMVRAVAKVVLRKY